MAPEIDGTLEEHLVRALDRRHDLGATRARLEAGRLEERVARAGFLPEVAVRGSYDLFDDTPFGSRGGSATVVAFARLNLYRGGADAAALESARSSTRSFEQLLRRFEDSVRLEVRQAWQELATARARQATASRSLAAAGEAVRVTQQRFRQGLERIVDLLDAETALREAQSRELSARYDALAETFRLRHLTGDSLVDSPVEVFE